MSDVYVFQGTPAADGTIAPPIVYGTVTALARALFAEDPVLQSVSETTGTPVVELFNFKPYARDLELRLTEPGACIEVAGGVVYRLAVLAAGRSGEVKEKQKPGRKPAAKPGKGKGRPVIPDEPVEEAAAS